MMQGKVNNKEPYVEQGLELTRRIHTNCYNIVETIRWVGQLSFYTLLKIFNVSEKLDL